MAAVRRLTDRRVEQSVVAGAEARTTADADRAAAMPSASPRVRKAAREEARAVGETLASAFFDDPVIGWAWQEPERRRAILPDFFELMAEGSLEHDEAYTTDDFTGAALWVPPAGLQPSDEEAAAFAGAVRAVTHEFADRVLQLFEILDERHPHEPHWYLPIVGTRPRHQGRGIGAALLAPVLEHCDREGIPAYLEATSSRNQALYLRLGFRVTGDIPLPGGPSLAPMWREPRTAGTS